MATPPRIPPSNRHFGFLPSPPPLGQVVARAMACCALAQRIEVEPGPQVADDAETRAATDDLIELSLEWLERHAMAGVLTPAERAALQAMAGELDPAARDRHADAGEAAAVLAWALRCAPLPAFDTDADAAGIATALGWLDEAGAALATTARLRHRDELGACLDAVSAVHWRLRVHVEPRPAATGDATAETAAAAGDTATASPPVGPVSMARWQPDRYAWPEGMTPLELAADGDLSIGGQSIASAGPQALLAALRRLRERHRAVLWLLGQSRDWDAIDLSL